MNRLNNQQTEQFIEEATWLKSRYVKAILVVKWLCTKVGILKFLDQRAPYNKNYHYLRSLLAIYQIEDMVQLDVPWWTYPAIQAIEDYINNLNEPPTVFEYGSGASTIWLAKRSSQVISIEHDSTWFEKLTPALVPFDNVTLSLRLPERLLDRDNYASIKIPHLSFKSYVAAIAESTMLFDIIVIDGRCRARCLKECLAYLKPKGIIVFDNSNRARYQAELLSQGLQTQRYFGRVPGSPFKSETAILSLS